MAFPYKFFPYTTARTQYAGLKGVLDVSRLLMCGLLFEVLEFELQETDLLLQVVDVLFLYLRRFQLYLQRQGQ